MNNIYTVKANYVLSTIMVLMFSLSVNAQFKKAEIKIYGLTCSLCSRSVEMALQKIDFIDKIETDLETTLTTVSFKEDIFIAPEELSKAVEKAGFSVGYIKITYNFNKAVNNCAEGEKESFNIIDLKGNLPAGEHVFLMVEKDMMSPKMYKEYKGTLPQPCTTTKRNYYVALADQLILN